MAAEGLRNAPGSSDAPVVASTQRVTVVPGIPAEWLDRLLAVFSSIRPSTGLEESSRLLLGAARDLLDETALGVCIPGGDEGQIVVRLAPARTSQPGDADPARLFPEFGFERPLVIQADHGSTLHVACNDEDRFVDGRPAQLFVERLAQIFAAMIENHRSLDRAQIDLKAQVIQSEKLASL